MIVWNWLVAIISIRIVTSQPRLTYLASNNDRVELAGGYYKHRNCYQPAKTHICSSDRSNDSKVNFANNGLIMELVGVFRDPRSPSNLQH
jgi:hypothetical protein